MANRLTVGNAEVIAVLDMVPPPRDPKLMFPDVSPGDWTPYRDALEQGRLQLYYGAWVVRSQGCTILVDTGIGPGPHPTRGNLTGNLYQELGPVLLPGGRSGTAGASPADEVDVVIHTHLHFDHVGWNVDYSGGSAAPTFPRARYLAPRLDWEYFNRPQVLAASPYIEAQVKPLVDLGKIEIIEGEHRVTDEVVTLPTPGHTPGHQVVLISSQGRKAMIVGDVLHSKVQVPEPGWTAGVDVDKEASRRSRQDLLDRAETEGYAVAAGHFHPMENIGKVARLEGRRYWQVL